MKIAHWNIRGFHKSLKQGGVQHLLRSKEIQVLALMETKLNEQTIGPIMGKRFAGMEYVHNFGFSNHGRILLLWDKQRADMEVITTTEQFIHTYIRCRISGRGFYVTFIYGLHSVTTRRPLWENLSDIGEQLSGPWMIMGDFNVVLSIHERQRGNPVTNYEMRDLQRFTHACGMVDLRSIGCNFTWTNGHVACKLDRAMVNSTWLMEDFDAYAEFLAPGCLSDHSCTMIHILDKERAAIRPFKFLNMWTLHPDYKRVVEQSWEVPVEGNAQYRLRSKLYRLKRVLRELNKKDFGHISEKAKRANQELEEMQKPILAGDPAPTNYGEVRRKATMLSEAEKLFYQQRAKHTYLRNSDKCTKFFHDVVKRNNKRNAIIMLTKRNGERTTTMKEVAEEFLDYFHGILGQPEVCNPLDGATITGRKLTNGQKESLIQMVEVEEIKMTLHDIGDDKSLGPDGYGSKFFTSAWDIIGSDFVDAIQEFFGTGNLLKQWNHSLIYLVPKSDHAEGVLDYRPISCCNVFYKVISKILARRLSRVMGFLIDPAQAAFVQGRSIRDNIFLTQELLRKYARKRVSPRCMAKVDLKKAFDMINWDFLMEALVGFGFPQQYCAWIKQCVITTTYSISLNGGIYGFFGGKRGLRQGDPLSPLLFGLCVEVLSRRIKDISELPTFHYHPRCKEVGLTHLIYADDLMLFARGDESSLKLFAECLEKFGNEAGLRANPIKSQLYMAGISATTKAELLGIMGFQEGVFPFRYLGIPLAAEKLRIANYGPLLDTISRKMKRWPRQTLSYAGKLELVQTVIQGTECYWFSMLPIPGGVIDKIKAMCRLFVWNSKYPPIAWDTISMPKENGGYGLKNLNVWNKALLTKVLWDIKSRADTIWSKWVHQHYVKGVDFWEWEATSLDSPLIKRLVEIKEEIKCNANGVGEANMMFMDWFIMEKKGVSKAYEFFQGTNQKPPWVPMLWRSEIMPKHRFIMWLLSHRKLRTADRMSYEANKECPICKQREETMDHLFFKCPFAHALWEKVKQWLDIKFRFNKIEELLNGVRRRYRGAGNKVKARFLGISSVLYHIWTTRNKCKIEGVPPSIEGSFRKVQIHVHRFVNLIDAG